MPLFTRIGWMGSRNSNLDAGAAQRTVAALVSRTKIHAAFDWLRSHEREISDFQLKITSVAAPPFQERERANFFAAELDALGYSVEQDEVCNVFATREQEIVADTAEASPHPPVTLMVTSHLDTVFPREVYSGTEPLVRRDHNRLLGPGISDNGAGLAAIWALARCLVETAIEPEGKIVFVGNVGEEGEGNLRGVRHMFAQPRWAEQVGSMLVVDGAGTDSIIAHALGSRRLEITVTGPGGHSWSDFGLPNPIVAIARVVDGISNISLSVNPKTTINVGTISGGTSVNAIPESATVRIDIRSTAVEQIDEVEQEVRRVAHESVASVQLPRSLHKQLQTKIKVVGDRPAAEIREDAPLLSAVRAVDSQLGIKARIHRASTDANIPLSMGVDSLALGAGGTGGGAHTLHEWFDPTDRDLGLRRILLVMLAIAGVRE